MMPGVDLLRQRLLFNRSGGDIVGNGRHIGGLPEACHDLLADRFVARIDMVKMNRGRVTGLLCPKMRDRARQQPQHAPHPLEIAERRRLAGQGFQHFRMQRVTRPEGLDSLGAGGIAGQGLSVGCPERPGRHP